MAEAKRPKKTFTEEAKKRKRENDQAKGRKRVNLRLAFGCWRELHEITDRRRAGLFAVGLVSNIS